MWPGHLSSACLCTGSVVKLIMYVVISCLPCTLCNHDCAGETLQANMPAFVTFLWHFVKHEPFICRFSHCVKPRIVYYCFPVSGLDH